MSGQGRGRGESAKIAKLDEVLRRPQEAGPSGVPIAVNLSSSSSGSNDGEKTIRGRGGFRSNELRTIPDNVASVKGDPLKSHQPMVVCANYFKVTPMKDRFVFQYRVDFEPNIESEPLRRRVFQQVTESTFSKKVIFDGAFDARSGHKTRDEVTTLTTEHPMTPGQTITVTVKRVGSITGGFEMTRVYNMNMKMFLKVLGFYQVSKTGAYVHPNLATSIGNSADIMALRGYRTSANVHEAGQILMNLEPVSKVVQRKNVLQNMTDVRNQARGNIREAIKAALTGKLCVTSYNKIVYRIEDVNFEVTPSSTFLDRKSNEQISYMQYYQGRYDKRISDANQPLLLVIQNNRRQADREEDKNDIYLVPELCNLAGLTDAQRTDNRLKTDMIRAAQIDPNVRVEHMNTFLKQLKDSQSVQETLARWGYEYGEKPVEINARILATEQIGMGNTYKFPPEKWPKVDHMASFDSLLQRETLAKAPVFKKLAILISRTDASAEGQVVGRLQTGFGKIGLRPEAIETHRIVEGDGAHLYVQYLKKVAQDASAAIVILPRQNKERYDAIKKLASVERGLITQVVTTKLMTDERKAGGASVKIAIQVAAKLGGEPWYVKFPLAQVMICGYDTYHDTANRGRSFGAFLASMNDRFSQWYSKTDSHDRLDELSTHMGNNLIAALRRYNELNKKFPERIFIYRDGVGDGQLEHVFNVELKNIKKVIKDLTKTSRLTFIVVNKRVGARFYMCNNNKYINPPPGSVIDDVVTRKERYDFYLISQSTRFGTVSPTYYNIIHDESGLDATKHQIMAYKMCFLYYNWTGSVMVPAPCQYAHKLALLCGEHLHAAPNSVLDDRLHFL